MDRPCITLTVNFIYGMNKEHLDVRIFYSDIYYFEAVKGSHYYKIVHDGAPCYVRTTAAGLMKRLPRHFIQVRASAIVNRNRIADVNCPDITMENGDVLSCTASYLPLPEVFGLFPETKKYYL